ncbi:MAG: sodium-translocating pyrophosphatase [Deltaproteobacteria bacterium GWA2_38_16]|nr:MAG: sodium-translocating pyrophosphatase [Deltaproteobacteria bacterium GWA2_38_16]OGQ03273.1 MAG: sodium-translocating pyrophosphatase [Deltaproteobacteria bacterium RIFCSPHIGHO2_02_FULL_38_15]OGQ34082.1 MAG: sodium-translocating pyrophosphatase [Deltaproteobacteria bacterium RIFCSPLOWO2_01_FULL_38_9]HBQ21849.1 sodium-translocating pyrophosphatase [Deltaproteobacteria bacterium]
MKRLIRLVVMSMCVSAPVFASEAELKIPEFSATYFTIFGAQIAGTTLLLWGIVVALLGMVFGWFEFMRTKRLPAHQSMLDVSSLIYETCKTYLVQQGKLLAVLEIFIGSCIFYYFYVLRQMELSQVLVILGWSVIGILGSFSVAWFGMRLNTYANSRTAFASLQGKPYPVMEIPLRSGMSIGVLLICVELVMMLFILLFIPKESAGACFIGFAIGESLGASALRICGGIFTKIADIGSDLMKIVFNIKEDDARNPGVIADCVGDNAGDSVGPTADGFETYGVTGVALISFIVLAVGLTFQAQFIIWIFTMRVLMIVTSVGSYWINNKISHALYGNKDQFNFEAPLTSLVWITSLVSMAVTYGVSFLLLKDLGTNLWWQLATIISCGTAAAALIPEFTKIFTSAKSKHVSEIVTAAREGGASLAILSGIVAGNFSAFWKGMVMVFLMLIAYLTSVSGLDSYMVYPTVFAFGLVAFGFLGMGPVTIAVDSYGPVTDNAQSVFELSQIEHLPNIKSDIEREFQFKPDFSKGKHFLEENDSAGNTFKATAKPVLIGTAVIGATTMIFSIILLLNLKLDLLNPKVLLGFITGGAVIYWFSGASMQAVTTGAYRAVEYIKKHIRLEGTTKADVEKSKDVVRICTQYAQAGMINIFGVIFCFTLAFACFDPTFFASYLISIAVFGLFQAIFMANAGGAWDNAKKVVEVDLKEKGTPLHAATVICDTVGDPFKDTSSVALNPIIKFTTLFGLLAVEIAVSSAQVAFWIGSVLLVVGLFFVVRSFYGMRITK